MVGFVVAEDVVDGCEKILAHGGAVVFDLSEVSDEAARVERVALA